MSIYKVSYLSLSPLILRYPSVAGPRGLRMSGRPKPAHTAGSKGKRVWKTGGSGSPEKQLFVWPFCPSLLFAPVSLECDPKRAFPDCEAIWQENERNEAALKITPRAIGDPWQPLSPTNQKASNRGQTKYFFTPAQSHNAIFWGALLDGAAVYTTR